MNYLYKKGDRVFHKGKRYIVAELYSPRGFGFDGNEPAYTLYPPGKSKSYGYYFWVNEKDLTFI